jgi:hypothetical protein
MSAQLAIEKLEVYAAELDKRSNELTTTQRELDDLTPLYDEYVNDYEVDLYEKCLASGTKLPSEKLRRQLAHKHAIPDEFLKGYEMRLRKRERLKKRISDLKTSVEAQRSVLSAEKAALV